MLLLHTICTISSTTLYINQKSCISALLRRFEQLNMGSSEFIATGNLNRNMVATINKKPTKV